MVLTLFVYFRIFESYHTCFAYFVLRSPLLGLGLWLLPLKLLLFVGCYDKVLMTYPITVCWNRVLKLSKIPSGPCQAALENWSRDNKECLISWFSNPVSIVILPIFGEETYFSCIATSRHVTMWRCRKTGREDFCFRKNWKPIPCGLQKQISPESIFDNLRTPFHRA